MPGRIQLTSAAGVLSLLDEDALELKTFALDRLLELVDEFWPEISDVVSKLEILYEDEKFGHREQAALLVSRVYYHLGSFDDSLTYALGAGDLFASTQPSEYYDTIIARAIDQYVRLANAPFNKQKKLVSGGSVASIASSNLPGQKRMSESAEPVDPRLEVIVNQVFKRCFEEGEYLQVIGIALECRRMDIFEQAITQSPDINGALSYAFKITMSLVNSQSYRAQLLLILSRLYKDLKTPDFINMVQCLIHLDDDNTIHELMNTLLGGGAEEEVLLAYQIGFDLYESATQLFLARLIEKLTAGAPIPEAVPGRKKKTPAAAASASVDDGDDAMDVEGPATPPGFAAAPAPSSSETADVVKPQQSVDDLSPAEKTRQERITKLVTILSGDVTIELDLQFLIRNNRTDLLILKHTKDAVRNSICHNATVIANGLMHCGTTSDQFLRDNLDWLGRAVNWAKFSATASLGVIHKRHEKEALHLMAAYLPKDNGPGSGYTEGGGLYALGLIHANHGAGIVDYLVQQLDGTTNESVKHGGCLGLGLAALGTQDREIFEKLKNLLYEDDAVVGEAAGIAIGLVMLGSNDQAIIKELISYAHESQHEKILRGISIGIGLMVYNRIEGADWLIERLIRDVDPLMRRACMHAIAMAYCGTGSNYAIRQLLHVAVSDVHDDVRRSAVEAIGFVLFRNPEQCPSVVSLLSESYNPHVRYGAAMALGIACAGSGNKEALALLEPMINDPTAFVRQGALISSALICVQQTEQSCPKSKEFRALYSKVISDKHDDVIAKFGAILAQGIIDAGGRNVTISLQSRTGHTSLEAVVGMLVFTQFWYWFPFAHFISLTFQPTSLIGLNGDLKMPKMDYKSNCKPSLYGYPAPLEEKKEKEREKLTTAVLSISSRVKKRQEAAEKVKKEEKMEVDEKPVAEGSKSPKKDAAAAEKKDEKKEEPSFEMLSNPARVMTQQLRHVSMPEEARYKPIKDLNVGGIMMLADLKAEDPEEIVEPVKAGGPKIEEEKEPEPPEPFEYTD